MNPIVPPSDTQTQVIPRVPAGPGAHRRAGLTPTRAAQIDAIRAQIATAVKNGGNTRHRRKRRG